MTAVNSSWITDATLSDGVLTLTMNGRTYDWPDADGSLYQGIISAPSAGRYFNQHLKGTAGNSHTLGTFGRSALLAAGRGLLTRGLV